MVSSARVKAREKTGNVKKKKEKVRSKLSYDCFICSKTFNKNYTLEDHVRRHHTLEKPFNCKTCNKSFHTNGDLWTHKFRHHRNNSRDFPCFKCPSAFKTNSDLNRHIKYVHEKKKSFKMKCPEPGCNQKCLYPSSLKKHLKIHRDPVSKLEFECADCGMWWETIEGYQKHRKVHHNPERPTSKCGFCNRLFESEELLLQHKIEKGHDKPKLYNCGYCRLEFSQRSKLLHHRTRPNHHKMVEEDEKLRTLEGFRRTLVTLNLVVDPIFPCNSCESSYNTEEELAQHKQMLHNNEPPKGTIYKCEEDGCDRVFERKSSHTFHLNTAHNKRMRSFGCKKCGRRLKSKKGLVTHKCGQLKGERQLPERKSNKKVPERANKSLQPENPTRSQPTRRVKILVD